MPREIPKAYEPQEIEERWAKAWFDEKLFRAENSADGPVFSIALPPPNITGSIHIGHMLEHTQIDMLVRWHRMRGHRTLWLPGMDHAGIATQFVVERQLAKEKIRRQDLGREEFERRVWQWKTESGGAIKEQMIRLGASCDWTRERFTLEPALYRAVIEAFLRLYREGLIYRGRYMVNWCPRCQTAISDLEVVHIERPGKLWHLRYPVVGSKEFLVVATTRPETMLGDTAVAVHPEDERYQRFIGKTVMLPLMDREIPVIADTYVDREFGTGVVKITPAHDPNDFEVGKRHNLPEIDVMTNDGHMSAAAGKYAGLDRFEARARIVSDLEALGLLEKIEDISHAVGVCDRCKSEVEPRISTQWFMKMKPLAEPAKEAVRRRLDRSRARQSAHDPAQLAGQHSRLVHFAPALVGPSHSHLALRGLQRDGPRDRFARRNFRGPRARRWHSHEVPEMRRRKAHAGYGRPRHMVQLFPLAILYARLAGRHAGPAHVSTPRAC